MYKYLINGNKTLSGKISVSGSKNASLPIIAATILNKDINELYNVPKIEDVNIMLKILTDLGCEINNNNKQNLIINSNTMNQTDISTGLMKKLRASILLVGAILGRFKRVTFSLPGGCNIGNRPIDLHIRSFRKLGVTIEENENKIKCTLDRIKSNSIYLDFPSVGATENIILISVLGDHEITIQNSATEPEIIDLADFLNCMGANIIGAGSKTIKIKGVKKLNSISYKIIPDRIEAGTLLSAFAITRGEGIVENVIPKHIDALLDTLKKLGCKIIIENNAIYINATNSLISTNIRTLPYPGFPTDMQPIITVLLLTCDGNTTIYETIFENRFEFTKQLSKMNADIKIENETLNFIGPQKLKGNRVECTDLRGGAAIALAGLVAEGNTLIDKVDHIVRGYEEFDIKLNKIGAEISRLY